LKDLINDSEFPIEQGKVLDERNKNKLGTKYVTSVICEFFRCILENHIAIQPA